MATTTGIWNHTLAAGQGQIGAGALASAAGPASDAASSSSSSSDSTTISANDFLTLLVTEMQNQDPTATSDPNEYINQLVSVNSLEQLIDINQTLSTNLSSTTSSGGAGSSPAGGAIAGVADAGSTSPAAGAHGAAPKGSALSAAQAAAVKQAPGNLSVPSSTAAAERVASSLGGRPHSASLTGGLSGLR